MHLDDVQVSKLKSWVIKKLENISDADSDVLADYVLALVKTDEPAHVAKSACVDNLQDFLGESSAPFVGDLFKAIDTGSFDPDRPRPASSLQKSTADERPARFSSHHDNSHRHHRQQNGSRKRAYHDWDGQEAQRGGSFGPEGVSRPMKQARRGGKANADKPFGQRGTLDSNRFPVPSMLSAHNQHQAFPVPPPGLPAFDPNNPMASFLAMQQMMSMFPGGLPGFPSSEGRGRCKNYDTQGFCAEGAACPFEHGNDPYLMPGAPADFAPADSLPAKAGGSDSSRREAHPNSQGNGRGRGRGHARGGGKQASLAVQGPMLDQSASRIVIEQIPEDKCDPETVASFFSQFGSISDVSLEERNRLAIVKFENHEAAKLAHDSPKVVFDNRFVKVSWYRGPTEKRQRNGRRAPHSREPTSAVDGDGSEAPPVDLEEIAKRQEEAQRKYEDHKRQLDEQRKQKSDLDAQLKAIEAEKLKMTALIARKAGAEAPPATESGGVTLDADDEAARNAGLRAQLAKLEAEAKSLGIDPNASTSHGRRGGFSFSGRGLPGFRGRGRGGPPVASRGGWAGGAVKRLDNRPKTVAITILDGTFEAHDEALRQWLLFNSSDQASLTPHPTRRDVGLLAFPERYLGEIFLKAAASPDFPLAGRVDLSWYVPETDNTQPGDMAEGHGPVASVPAESSDRSGDPEPPGQEVDYDIAADDELWG